MVTWLYKKVKIIIKQFSPRGRLTPGAVGYRFVVILVFSFVFVGHHQAEY